jgi:hypothetical protein
MLLNIGILPPWKSRIYEHVLKVTQDRSSTRKVAASTACCPGRNGTNCTVVGDVRRKALSLNRPEVRWVGGLVNEEKGS